MVGHDECMCKDRSGEVAVPNVGGPGVFTRALQVALRDAVARLCDGEQLVSDSVRVEGSGSPHPDDDAVMVFRYMCTVVTPDCPGWSSPV